MSDQNRSSDSTSATRFTVATTGTAQRGNEASVLVLYRQLFETLERDGVAYCVWKNLNELPEALAGRGDIDLHVRPRSRAALLDALRAHRFVRVGTHKAHPWVAHYYGMDEPSGTLCHLHCYFRLVTGESHIKQYVLPIERYLDVLPTERNALGVRELHPWLQHRLHLFRRRIKLSCLPGALLYCRERDGYRAERALLERRPHEPGERMPLGGWPTTIAVAGATHHDLAAGLVYRRRFRHWSRFAPFTTPIARYGTILLRALGKSLDWRKTLPLGLLVMVSAERAASARIRQELDDWLGADLQLRSFHLPDAEGSTTSHRLLRRCRRRRSTLRAALRAAADGSLVICYGWHPSRLRETLAATAAGTSGRTRLALERCAVQLDETVEPDVILRGGGEPLPDTERGGASLVDIESEEPEATTRWQRALWRALVDHQH